MMILCRATWQVISMNCDVDGMLYNLSCNLSVKSCLSATTFTDAYDKLNFCTSSVVINPHTNKAERKKERKKEERDLAEQNIGFEKSCPFPVTSNVACHVFS